MNEFVEADTLVVKTEQRISRDTLLQQRDTLIHQIEKIQLRIDDINRKLDLWDSGKR